MPQISHNFFNFKNNKIHYVSCGEESWPTVVLLGPGIKVWEIWKGLIDELAKNGFRAITIDLPGRGETQYTDKKFNLDTSSDLLSSFISELKITDPILIGASYGGMAVIHSLEHGDIKPKKVVLLETGQPFYDWLRPLLKTITRPAVHWEKTHEFYQKLLAKTMIKEIKNLRPDQCRVVASLWEDLLRWRMRENKKLTADVLAVIGWRDMTIDKPVTREVFPNAKFRLEVFAEVRHGELIDRLAKDHYGLIIDFLRSV